MEQDNAETSGGGFVPKPMTDILTPRAAEPAQPPVEAKPEPAPQPEATGEPPAQSKPEQPRAADGKFVPKDAQAEAAPPAAKQDAQAPTLVPVSVAQEERKKRQALEREVAELRAKLAPQPAQQQPPQPAPQAVPLTDLMFQDPERFVATLRQQQEEALIQTRLATSEAIARQQPDYDDAEQALTAYAQSSPQAAQEVAQALRSHPAPAMWAYQAGKQLLSQQRWAPLMQQHGDPEAFIAAEVERRLAERMAQAAPAPAPSAAPLPQSLASARAAGPRNPAPAFRGPTPMSAILGRR